MNSILDFKSYYNICFHLPSLLTYRNCDIFLYLQGVLQPENIAIHVAQNAVNFISSSIAWLAIGAFASQGPFTNYVIIF